MKQKTNIEGVLSCGCIMYDNASFSPCEYHKEHSFTELELWKIITPKLEEILITYGD